MKEYHAHRGAVNPALSEFQNLEKARSILPDNVVSATRPLVDSQKWLVRQRVFKVDPTRAQLADAAEIARRLSNGGVKDVPGNLLFGYTHSNATPRWIFD